MRTKKARVKTRTKQVKDWRTLPPGTRIQVSGGPYYGAGTTKHSLGVKGECKVARIDTEGIIAFLDNATVFIYMGPERPGVVGIKRPHKIRQIINEQA